MGVPDDVLAIILNFLDQPDWITSLSVCRQWHNLATRRSSLVFKLPPTHSDSYVAMRSAVSKCTSLAHLGFITEPHRSKKDGMEDAWSFAADAIQHGRLTLQSLEASATSLNNSFERFVQSLSALESLERFTGEVRYASFAPVVKPLSSCKRLTHVAFRNSSMHNLNGYLEIFLSSAPFPNNELAPCTPLLSRLQFLSLSGSSFDDHEWEVFVRSVMASPEGCPVLETLDLSRSDIDTSRAADLTEIFAARKLPALRKLNLSESLEYEDIPCEMMGPFFDSLASNCPLLTHLDLSECFPSGKGFSGIEGDTARALSALIASCPLKCLKLHWNEISAEGVFVLARGIALCPTLELLDEPALFSAHAPGSPVLDAVAQGCPSLRFLAVDRLDQDGLISLASVLRACRQLQMLKMAYFSPSPSDTSALDVLVESLKQCHSLTCLRIDNPTPLLSALPHLPNLRKLHMWFFEGDIESSRLLSQARSLTHLSVGTCYHNDQLASAIANMTQLEHVTFEAMATRHALVIADVLDAHCPHLKSLYVRFVTVRDEPGESLFDEPGESMLHGPDEFQNILAMFPERVRKVTRKPEISEAHGHVVTRWALLPDCD